MSGTRLGLVRGRWCSREDAENQSTDWVMRNRGLHEGLDEKGVIRRGVARREAVGRKCFKEIELKDYHYSINALDID